MSEAVQVAQRVAGGDLTADIQSYSNDETGQLLQALKIMNDSLLQIVGEVRSGTDTIATASGQIATGNLDLSSRTEQQASSLEETASAMEELTSIVKQNADNARQANQLAVMDEVTQQNAALVEEAAAATQSLQDQAAKLSEVVSIFKLNKVNELGASITKPPRRTIDITPLSPALTE